MSAAMTVLTLIAHLPAVGQESPPESVDMIGTAQRALVGVQVSCTAADGSITEVRHGNGLLIRCDGFICVPAPLVARVVRVAGREEVAAARTITAILNPGSSKEQSVTVHTVLWSQPSAQLTVMKIPDMGGDALRTLLPRSLTVGDKLQVWYSRWDPQARRYVTAVHAGAALTVVPAVGDEAGVATAVLDDAGALPPTGAIVTGPLGMAIGVAQATPLAGVVRIATFAGLYNVTNCVGSDSAPEIAAPPAGNVAFSSQVVVPGGKMLVPIALAATQLECAGATTVRIDPFRIDRLPVTNAEYLAFWNTLPAAQRRWLGFRNNHYPATWAPFPAVPPFPSELALYPVLEVPLEGAREYAAWRGERLATPYEWCLAALGPPADAQMPLWVAEYLNDRRTAWDQIVLTHKQYAQQHPEVAERGALVGGPYQLPWIAATQVNRIASQFSKQVIDRYLDDIFSRWLNPAYVGPVGDRPFDRSRYELMDTVMNGSQMVMPNPAPPNRGAPEYAHMEFVPEKPNPLDPWVPRPIEAITGGSPLQPLSRLFRRKLVGPSAAAIVMWSHLNETISQLQPVSGWRLALDGSSQTTAVMWPAGIDPYGSIGRPPGFDLWTDLPPHFRREMGMEVPLDAPEPHGAPTAQLFYYLPVGFRCAW